MRLRSTLPPLLLALSALALAAQAMTLKWSPKAGDKVTYKVTGNFEVGGGDIVLTGTRTEEVKSVEADKIVISGVSKLNVNAMGNDIPVPETVETTTQKADGTVTDVKVGDAASAGGMRLAHMSTLVYPAKAVAVGDTWTSEGAKDEKADLPGYKIEYKLVGDEKVGTADAWKITAKGGEIEGQTPTKVETTYWIDKKDGSLVRSLSKLTDALLSPEAPPLSGKMEIVRQP